MNDIALAIAAAVLAPHSTLHTDAWPPLRFQGDPGAFIVQVGGQLKVDDFCGASTPPMQTIACANPVARQVMLPDPCMQPAADYYAQIVCHEVAHLNGWPLTHGD